MGGGSRSASGSGSRFAGTGADTIGEGDMRALTLVGKTSCCMAAISLNLILGNGTLTGYLHLMYDTGDR
jgi:hypothetical protein